MKSNFVLLMAGRGHRFQGANRPKPLIEFNNSPLFLNAIKGIQSILIQNDLFLVTCKADKIDQEVEYFLNNSGLAGTFISLEHRTRGPVESAKLAIEKMEMNKGACIFFDCDFYAESNELATYLSKGFSEDAFVCFNNTTDPANSFIKTNSLHHVTQIVEKEVISNQSVVGIYGFKNRRLFLDFSSQLDFGSKEIYFSHVLQMMIDSGLKVRAIPTEMYKSLGTPNHLKSAVEI